MSRDLSTSTYIPLMKQRGPDNPEICNIALEPNKYHDFECCEWTRGIDTLLLRYKHDREEITSLIKSNPNKLINTIWKQEGPLAIDNECRCQMGKGENRSPFACAQCKNLRRLIDFRFGGAEKVFQIECGDYAGKKFIVFSTEIVQPSLSWDRDSSRRAQNYVKQYSNLTSCGTPDVENLECITGDSFTIRTLIMWMVSKIFEEKGLPHIPKLHTAFICSGTGYSLYDMPNIGSLSDLHQTEAYHNLDQTINITSAVESMKSQHFTCTPLKPEIVRTIIIQLLVILTELSLINFSHGTPSIHSLVFTKDPISYMYDSFHVKGPITLQITDMNNSSATFNHRHFFPKNIKSAMYIERNMFIPEIHTKTVSMAHCHDVSDISKDGAYITYPDETTRNVCKSQGVALYRLTNSTIDIYNAIRHIGFPLFVSSFDFYCLMISLMCDKSFFDAVLSDEKLYRLWSMMWLVEDVHNVEQLIKEAHDTEAMEETPLSNQESSNVAVNIIKGKWLRCDITPYIWNLIKLGW